VPSSVGLGWEYVDIACEDLEDPSALPVVFLP